MWDSQSLTQSSSWSSSLVQLLLWVRPGSHLPDLASGGIRLPTGGLEPPLGMGQKPSRGWLLVSRKVCITLARDKVIFFYLVLLETKLYTLTRLEMTVSMRRFWKHKLHIFSFWGAGSSLRGICETWVIAHSLARKHQLLVLPNRAWLFDISTWFCPTGLGSLTLR